MAHPPSRGKKGVEHMEQWLLTAYWICLAVGLVYTVISFVLGEISGVIGHVGDMGAGHGDFSHDYGVDGQGGHGAAMGADVDTGNIIFGPFSPLVIAFFLTCFGVTGVALTQVGKLGAMLSLPISIASSFVLAWLLILFFNKVLGSLQTSSEVKLHTLIGEEAEVTVAIPTTGAGEIAYIAMGSRCVTPARSEDQVAIARGSIVRISRIVGHTFYVGQITDAEETTAAPTEPALSSDNV